jgi:hypothetical protein
MPDANRDRIPLPFFTTIEVRGVPLLESCAREQEAYFAVGELTRGISLALVALWAVFLLVPPPGSEVAEAVDLVGLFIKVTGLVAATACTVGRFRSRRTHRNVNP